MSLWLEWSIKEESTKKELRKQFMEALKELSRQSAVSDEDIAYRLADVAYEVMKDHP